MNKLTSKILLIITILILNSIIFLTPVGAYSTSFVGDSSDLAGALCSILYLIPVILILWMLISKTGYPGCYSILLLIPIVNIIYIIILTFSEWPVEKELKETKEKLRWKEDELEKMHIQKQKSHDTKKSHK